MGTDLASRGRAYDNGTDAIDATPITGIPVRLRCDVPRRAHEPQALLDSAVA